MQTREVILFTDDTSVSNEVELALQGSDTEMFVKRSLDGTEAAVGPDKRAFLLHLTQEQTRGMILLEGLFQQSRAIGARIIVITEGLSSDTTIKLLKQFGLRGYIPRGPLFRFLRSRLEAIFEGNHILRQHRRVTTSFPVNFELLWLKKMGQCTSFSEGGMFVQTLEAPPVDVDVRLNFMLPEERRPRSIKGHVIYKTPAGFGVQFENNVPNIVETIEAGA